MKQILGFEHFERLGIRHAYAAVLAARSVEAALGEAVPAAQRVDGDATLGLIQKNR